MKKLTSIILTVLIVLSSFTAFGQEYLGKNNFYDTLSTITYQDISYLPADHWSNDAVFTVSALGIMKGSYNLFNPYDTVTATEALAVVLRCAGLEEECTKMYNSVSKQREQNPYLYNNIDRWADGYMRMAVDKKLININEFMSAMDINYPNNDHLFSKEQPITRATFVIWMVKALDLAVAQKENLITDFADYKDIEVSKMYFETALKLGIISGSGDYLNPFGNITREQLAQIIYNSLHIWAPKSGYTIVSGMVDDVIQKTENTETNLLDSTSYKVADNYLVTQRQYVLNGEEVDYTENRKLVYRDFPVIKQHSLPSDATAISKSSFINAYIKDGEVKAVVVKNNDNETINANYDGYIDSTVYFGKLYIADPDDRTIVVENDGKLSEVPYFKDVEIFHKTKLISPEELNEKYIDKQIFLFTVKKSQDSVERCYRVQLVDN